ncbi:MAG: nucleotide exchange factor GrpE [Janthinobacterium lividum]
MTESASPEALEVPVLQASVASDAMVLESVEVRAEPGAAERPVAAVGEIPAPAPQAETPDPIAELTAAVYSLTAEVEKHHDRAKHREGVIDNLHAEAERLRIGERRGAVRPLLVELARLRDDLQRQTTVLPAEIDRDWTRRLLLSFADTIEVTLEDYGIAIDTPKQGDDFNVRQHKVVASAQTDDPALVRKIADVRRDGYRDIEVDIPIAQAGVTVYVAAPTPAPDPVTRAEPVATAPEPVTPAPEPAPASQQRSQPGPT